MAEIRGAVLSPLEAAGIRLRVEFTRGDMLRFAVILEEKDIELEPNGARWTGLIDAAFAQRAADGRDLGATFFALRPDLDASQRVDGERKGLGFTKEIAAKPGVVEVRVVVADRATGRLGSVIVPVSADR